MITDTDMATKKICVLQHLQFLFQVPILMSDFSTLFSYPILMSDFSTLFAYPILTGYILIQNFYE